MEEKRDYLSLENIIAIVLTFMVFAIFINKFVIKTFKVLTVLLIIRAIKENKKLIVPYSIIGLIIIYNYKVSTQYFYINAQGLNAEQVKEYAVRIIGFITMTYSFANKNIVSGIYKYLKQYKKVVLGEVILGQLVDLALLVTGKGFVTLWGLKNFTGMYTNSPHQYGYSLIVMVVIIEWIIDELDNKNLFVLQIVPMATSVLTGARTPFVAMVGIYALIKLFKNKKKSSFKINVRYLIVTLITLSIVIFISSVLYEFVMNSNMVEKFATKSEGTNFDSGRTEFWTNILGAFFNDFTNEERLLGHGINYTILINFRTVGMQVWAHSDFVDIIVSYGFILLMIYIFFYVRYFYRLKKMGINKFLAFGLLFIFIFLSAGNGIINYACFIPIFCYFPLFINEKDSLLEYGGKDGGEEEGIYNSSSV